MSTTSEANLPEGAPVAGAASQRLMSVDALRGFDMFWIIGADSLVSALYQMSQNAPTRFLAGQLEHAAWEGFHFYDLIFPLFVFIVGVSLVFSLTKAIERVGRRAALKRVFARSLLLFVAGLFYSGGFTGRWPDLRLMGVLNRIALAYFFTGLLFCFCRPRALAGVCVSLLAAYWALLTFVPIRDIQLTRGNVAALAAAAGDEKTAAFFRSDDAPNPSGVRNSAEWAAAEKLFYATTNYVRGQFGKGLNLADHFDFQFLPGRKYDTFFDPEGYLSTAPAVATCLLGVFAGLLLRNRAVSERRKVLCLVGLGAVAAAAGWLWGLQFPVIKKIWTSSYVLVAGGYSAMVLGVFYLVVDVWQARRWCQPFVWLGMNSITIYLAGNVLDDFRGVALRLAGGDVAYYLNEHVARGLGELLISLVSLVVAFAIVRFLHRRKIFLRL